MKYIICVLLILSLTGCFKTKNDDIENPSEDIISSIGNITNSGAGNIEDLQEKKHEARDELFYDDIKSFRQKGDLGSAKKLILSKLLEFPNDESLLTQLGLIYIQDYKYEEAIDIFSEIIEMSNNNIGSYLNIALVYHKLNKDEQYREYIDKAKEINPNSAQITEFLTDLDSDDNSEGIEENSSGDNAELEEDLFLLDQKLLPIRVNIEENEYKDALDRLLEVEKENPNNTEIQKLIANCYLGLEKYQEAIEKYSLLYKSEMSKDFDVLFGMTIAYYNLRDQVFFKDFLEESKKVSNEEEKQVILKFESDIILDNGDLPLSPTFNESYTEGGSQFSKIQIGLDDIQTEYDIKKDGKSALILAETLDKNYPNHPKVLYWLGRINFLEGNLQEGYDFYLRSDKLLPNDLYTLEGLFWASIRLGNKGEAESYFNQAIELDIRFESMDAAKEVIQ